MKGREKRVEAEAAALWRTLYHEPPPTCADGARMLELMLERLPVTGYDRLATPHLRRPGLTWPRRAPR